MSRTFDDLQFFASEKVPLHMSLVPKLMQCEVSVIRDFLVDERTPAGEAAATGTAVAKAIELYHSGDADPLGNCWQSGGYLAEQFSAPPKMDHVEKMFNGYVEDPRNRGAVVQVEQKVRLTIPPDPLDPTGEPVILSGRYDQERTDPVAGIWDLKAGKFHNGGAMVMVAWWQLAVYALATGKPAGGIIRLRDYTSRSLGPVFYPAQISVGALDNMKTCLARQVAMVRRKSVSIRPGVHCAWCDLGHPEECSK